ncbi:hypothetical protein Tco_0132762 [Tanacetum coccineum]
MEPEGLPGLSIVSVEVLRGMIKGEKVRKLIMSTEMELTLEQPTSVSMKSRVEFIHNEDGTSNSSMVGRSFTDSKSPPDHKMAKFIKMAKRLCLVDDLTVLKITSPLTSKDKGTSLSLKSKITTTYSQEKVKFTS